MQDIATLRMKYEWEKEMLKTYEREKLLNVIIYFANTTAMCGKTKLCKLLYLLDFEHYKQTGRSVTGLDYYAWEKGPVPVKLYDELSSPEDDLLQSVELKEERVINYKRMNIVAKGQFDESYFSKRELRLLESLAAENAGKNSDQMVQITHAPNTPWTRVYSDGMGYNERIPYELAIEGEHAADLIQKAKEYDAIKLHYAS